MTTINDNTFLLTLSYGNDYVGDYDLTNYPIVNSKYFSVYSTYSCSIFTTFTNLGYQFDLNGNLAESKAIDTLEDVGTIYECKDLFIKTGKITLNKQDNMSYPQSITLVFTFWKNMPEMIEGEQDCEYLTLNFNNALDIAFDLGTTPISGYKYFQMFSNINSTFKVSFTKANEALAYNSSTGDLTLDTFSKLVPVNVNKLEKYESGEKTGLYNGTISSFINDSDNQNIYVIFYFFKK